MAVVPGNCAVCGTFRPWLQRDHVIPRYLGGTDDPSNIQRLCANCHEDKSRAEASDASKRRKPPVYTAEMRQRMSDAAVKRHRTAWASNRGKMSEAGKKSWETRRANGRDAFTAEHRANLSRAQKGRVFTEAHKANMRSAATLREERRRVACSTAL